MIEVDHFRVVKLLPLFVAQTPRDLFNSAEDSLNVGGCRSWIHHHHPQNSAAVEHGGANVGKPAFVQFFLDCPVLTIGIAAGGLAPKVEA